MPESLPPFGSLDLGPAVRPTPDGYGLTVSWFADSFMLVFAGQPPVASRDYPRWHPLSPVRLAVACRAISRFGRASPPAAALWLPVAPAVVPPGLPPSPAAWLLERLRGGPSFVVDVDASSYPPFRARVQRLLAPDGGAYQLRLSVPPALVIAPALAGQPLDLDIDSDALGLGAHFAPPAGALAAAFAALGAACPPVP